MVHDRARHGVEPAFRVGFDGKRMVVDHVEMVAVVALGDAALAVVARVDPDPPVPHVRGGIGHVVGGE